MALRISSDNFCESSTLVLKLDSSEFCEAESPELAFCNTTSAEATSSILASTFTEGFIFFSGLSESINCKEA